MALALAPDSYLRYKRRSMAAATAGAATLS